ncbi:pseudouridine synthase [Furfurilactobacillus curtus]|uniref:Pseudouridine synthase n=1 Tax=Furfurilactobacillus curtus TaxID=1746200 RepID=A0ABQ5JKA3_9LACO
MGTSMRIDRYLTEMRVATRRQTRQLIKAGHVRLNQQLVTQARQSVDPNVDIVTVGGERVIYQPFVYYLMNKPVGVVTATTDVNTTTVMNLINAADFRDDLFPVGRLDKDTTGALLITNDGELGHRLTSPKHHVLKQYRATITGTLSTDDVAKVAEGITLKDGTRLKPATLTVGEQDLVLNQTTIRLTLAEGKYHQVKRMVGSLGQRVIALDREAFGPLTIGSGGLLPGHYRTLTEIELAATQRAAGLG